MRSRDDAAEPGFEHAATVASVANRDTEEVGAATRADVVDRRVERGDQIDRFTVVEELGAGGMGQVVAAHDPELDRKVAIKTLRTELFGSASPEATMRLMREARAMAKLSHPNVVTVYEVGTIGAQIYIAMELVDGGTLRDWLSDARPWSEIVAVFVQAGRGLEAAHAAGLVHRDFKPENVLVDTEGRVKVTDFGLVGTSSEVQEPGTSEARTDTPLMVSLTQTGAVMGTPLYMAPEQHHGERTDARADQFAFCVSLYEALYGRHPFAAESRAELVGKVLDGELEPPPKASRVPSWVHDIVVRGLGVRPDHRFASMAEVVAALERDPGARRRRVAMAVAILSIAAAAAAVLWWKWPSGAGSVCRGSEERLAGVWDTASKADVRAAFEATKLPLAGDSFERAAARIDAYTRDWVGRRTDSCEAARDHHELSPAQLDLRMNCFDTRLHILSATVDRWRAATEEEVEAAIDTAFALPGLDPCTNTRALSETFPLPDDATARKHIDELNERLARARADYRAGDFGPAEAISASVVGAIEGLDYPPLLGAALLLQAESAQALSKGAEAEVLLRRAIEPAAKARDDALAAGVWSALIYALGYEQGKYADALALQPALEAAISRGDIDEADAAQHLVKLARVYEAKGDLRVALEQYEEALAVFESADRGSTPTAAALRGSIAGLYTQFERFDEAEQMHQRAIAELVELMGPKHFAVATAHTDLAEMLLAREEVDEAETHLVKAYEIVRDSYGPRHIKTANALGNLGMLIREKGDLERAAATLAQALEILESQRPAVHPDLVPPLVNLGLVSLDREDYEPAHALMSRAAEIQLQLAPEHPDTAVVLMNLALVELGREDFEHALSVSRQALSIVELALAGDHKLAADALATMGDALVELKRPDEALPHLERAMEIYAAGAAGQANPIDRGYAELTLAQALWDSKSDRSRALDVARAGRDHLVEAGDESGAADIDQWLAEHGARP